MKYVSPLLENQSALDLAVCHLIAASFPTLMDSKAEVESESPFGPYPIVRWDLSDDSDGGPNLQLSLSRQDMTEGIEWAVSLVNSDSILYVQPVNYPLSYSCVKAAISDVFHEALVP